MEDGKIHSRCADNEWTKEPLIYLIDVGMSSDIIRGSDQRLGLAALEITRAQDGSTVVNAIYPEDYFRLN